MQRANSILSKVKGNGKKGGKIMTTRLKKVLRNCSQVAESHLWNLIYNFMIFKVMVRPILVDFVRTMDQGCFKIFTTGNWFHFFKQNISRSSNLSLDRNKKLEREKNHSMHRQMYLWNRWPVASYHQYECHTKIEAKCEPSL